MKDIEENPIEVKIMSFHKRCKICTTLYNKEIVDGCPRCNNPSPKDYRKRVKALLGK
jgi:rRNA maturation endonuclease Nob1|tara:strand:+ start:7004 stop:7174 length:171 start_codon:yes stop_codon:yes gene_type:complete